MQEAGSVQGMAADTVRTSVITGEVPNYRHPANSSPAADHRRAGNQDSLCEGDEVRFTRITVNPRQMGGVPCLRGLRVPVATIVGMVAEGMTTDEILRAYPDLEPEDIREALSYAAEAMRERVLPLVHAP